MNKPQEIKQMLSPIVVAERYLGEPDKMTGNRLWYKSPFRKEKTASFMVSEQAFHDFGDGWHGDIIDFVQKYYNTDFITAIRILSTDFRIPEIEQISPELSQYLKQKRDEERQIKEAIKQWFNVTYCKLCERLQLWQKVIPKLQDGEMLYMAYGESGYIEYLIDIFFDATEEEKIELWKDREVIEQWIKD